MKIMFFLSECVMGKEIRFMAMSYGHKVYGIAIFGMWRMDEKVKKWKYLTIFDQWWNFVVGLGEQ